MLLNYYNSVGIAFGELAWVSYFYYDGSSTSEMRFGMVDLGVEASEDSPDYADVNDYWMYYYGYFGSYGFGAWYYEEISDDPVESCLFKLQVVDDEDNYELFDELDLWVFGSAGADNVNSVVVLQGATTLIAASTVALLAALA